MGGRRPRPGPRRRDAALPAPATGRAQTRSRAAGKARAPASGRSDGGQAEARSAGTRARRDRRQRPRWAQGCRGPKVPQTLPSSGPAPAGGQAAVDNGQAGCGQHPWDAHLSCCSRGPACLAWPAWHRFLDPPPTPREAASPPHPPRAQGPLPRPRQRAQPSHLRRPRGRTRSPLREEAGVGNLFFLSFSFLQ